MKSLPPGGSFLGRGHGMRPQLALERFILSAIETKTAAMAGLGEERSDDEHDSLLVREDGSQQRVEIHCARLADVAKRIIIASSLFAGPPRNGSRAWPMMPLSGLRFIFVKCRDAPEGCGAPQRWPADSGERCDWRRQLNVWPSILPPRWFDAN
jgi:hypothetical protein